MAGKGSKPRPIPDREQFYRNWDAIEWGTLGGSTTRVVHSAPKAGTISRAEARRAVRAVKEHMETKREGTEG